MVVDVVTVVVVVDVVVVAVLLLFLSTDSRWRMRILTGGRCSRSRCHGGTTNDVVIVDRRSDG